jgi:enediyne biosynthesis protein E4
MRIRNAVLLTWALTAQSAAAGTPWLFTERSGAAGASSTHGIQFGPYGEPDMMSGGVAAGDVDGDGWVDLLVLRGDLGPARLLHNLGNGSFFDEALARGLDIRGGLANGALMADLDGDGDLDVLTGGLYIADAQLSSPPRLWRNDGSGHFVEAGTFLDAWDGHDSWSSALGDIDGDGDLDLAFGRWSTTPGARAHLFLAQAGSYVASDGIVGLDTQFPAQDHSFTPNFADIDGDGDADLLFTGDFHSSRIFRNDAGSFSNQTDAVISDENGMGAAVGDYDNDGDLDWFVSSIYDTGTPAGNWGTSGNRLYRNAGDGSFSDATDLAGVRAAGWGWGSCFADFNADGWLDLYVVNGMLGPTAAPFNNDPARLFINNGDGSFSEQGAARGVADTGQGRGLVCFDYDRDGDIDIYIQNGYGAARLYRNDLAGARSLTLRLRGHAPNAGAIGARVWLQTDAGTQMRELAAGNNFLSSNPPELYFGLGASAQIERLRVRWPDGSESAFGNRPALAQRLLDADSLFDDGVE